MTTVMMMVMAFSVLLSLAGNKTKSGNTAEINQS